MNCETCQTKDFVHSDLYCRGCKDKPKTETVSGTAYLFRKVSDRPITSVEMKAPKGWEYEFAALELVNNLRIEFIGD